MTLSTGTCHTVPPLFGSVDSGGGADRAAPRARDALWMCART